MSNLRRTGLAVAVAACALALFDWDDAALTLLPGWTALKAVLRPVEPFLINTVLVLLDVLLVMLLVGAALRLADREGRPPGIPAWFGLTASPLPAIRLVGLAVTPAYLAFALTQPVNADVASYAVAYLAFIGPFAEEVIYRGAAFGLLRRLAGWPFWLAAGLPAVFFGLGHANPFTASPSMDAIMTFAITFTGAIMFSWLYERWQFNLWVPILLHAFLNFAWSLFQVGDGAFAGWLPLAAQVTTVGLAIVLTIRWRHAARGQAAALP